jgi:hypothetical protein
MKLVTTYLGLKLRTPLVPSASPLSEKLDNIKRMEDAGAAAVVFHSPAERSVSAAICSILGRTPRWIMWPTNCFGFSLLFFFKIVTGV